MSVKNIKVSNIRKEGYENLEKWMDGKDNIYIGRSGVVFINGQRFPKEPSKFCNPYKIGKDGTREEVIEKYGTCMIKKLEDPSFMEEFLKLKDKNLGCWCKPEPCHGDVLLELLEKYST